MTFSSRDRQAIWHPYTQSGIEGLALAIVKGSGTLLWDEEGKEYIDAISSWWVNLHGHSHPHISKRIAEQLEKLHHVMFAGFTHPPAVELAETLRSMLPDSTSRIFFSDNGSTAVEVALKICAQFWRNQGSSRKKIIALNGSYHGDTIGAMSASSPSPFRAPFEDWMFEVKYIPRPIDGSALLAMEREIAEGDVAAFIFEPLIQGAAGMQIYSASELGQIIKLCKDDGVLTIADEVFTGFGRTGRVFASNYLDFSPDIFCLSKGLTGGSIALGVTSAPDRVYKAFESNKREQMFLHGHSYTANPLACSAALASMELFNTAECELQRKQIELWHEEFAKELQSHPGVSNARSLGTILAFEVGTSSQSSYLNPLRDKLYKYFIENGVILRPLGNTIYSLPPYCITRQQIQKVYEVILNSLEIL